MPTYERMAAFRSDYRRLTAEQRRLFRQAVNAFRADLGAGTFRRSLRIKKLSGYEDIWELTFAADGRATFHYGPEVLAGHRHIVWRRIGSHDIFLDP